MRERDQVEVDQLGSWPDLPVGQQHVPVLFLQLRFHFLLKMTYSSLNSKIVKYPKQKMVSLFYPAASTT